MVVCIVTNRGSFFTSLQGEIPVSGAKEVYVSELKPGDVISLDSDYVSEDPENFISVLSRLAPGYNEARTFCYIGSVPRLQYYLVRGMSSFNPSLFLEEEISDIEAYATGNKDLSDKTKNQLTNFINYLMEKNGVKHFRIVDGQEVSGDYSRNAYRDWISGNVIYPENPAIVPIVAREISYDEMFYWGFYISSTPNQDNPYRKLVLAHSSTSSALSGLPEKPPERSVSGKERKKSGSIYKDVADWRKQVVREVESRKKNRVVDAIVKDVIFVDQVSKGSGESATSEGVHKGVLVVNNKTLRKDIYDKLGVVEPEARSVSLERSLKESFDIYKQFLWRISEIYEQIFIARARSGVNTDASAYTPFKISRCFTPMFNYDVQTRILREEDFTLWKTLVVDRDARRDYLKKLKRDLPRDHIIYTYLMDYYNSSIVFRSLYTEAEFTRKMTEDVRLTDVSNIERFSSIPFDERLESLDLSRANDTTEAVLNALRSDKTSQELLTQLIKVDTQIPRELTGFRSTGPLVKDAVKEEAKRLGMPVVNPVSTGNSSEIDVFSKVCGVYRIDGDIFLEPFRQVVVSCFTELSDRLKRDKEDISLNRRVLDLFNKPYGI